MYCTNCGNPSEDKICKVCGVKKNQSKNFCAHCGMQLVMGCSKCPNCSESVKIPAIFKILNVIRFLAGIGYAIGSLVAFAFLGTLSQYDSITKYAVLAVILLIVSVALIVVPGIITKKNNANNKSRTISMILTLVMIVAAVVINGIAQSEYARIDAIRIEAEQKAAEEAAAAQLDKEYGEFTAFFAEGKYSEALAYVALENRDSRFRQKADYADYCNYANGMIAFEADPYCETFLAIEYLNKCSEGFLDTAEKLAEIRGTFSQIVGLFEMKDSPMPVYLSINENGEVGFVVGEDKYAEGVAGYTNKVCREKVQASNGEGWTIIITESHYENGEFEYPPCYTMVQITDMTNGFALLGINEDEFAVYEGYFIKISDTPLPQRTNY